MFTLFFQIQILSLMCLFYCFCHFINNIRRAIFPDDNHHLPKIMICFIRVWQMMMIKKIDRVSLNEVFHWNKTAAFCGISVDTYAYLFLVSYTVELLNNDYLSCVWDTKFTFLGSISELDCHSQQILVKDSCYNSYPASFLVCHDLHSMRDESQRKMMTTSCMSYL